MPWEHRRRFGDFMGNVAVVIFFGALIFGCFAFAVQSTNEARAAAQQQYGGGFGGSMSNVDVRTIVMPMQTFGGFGAPQRRETSSCGYDPYGTSQPYFIYERPSNGPCQHCGQSPYGSGSGW